MSSEYERFKSLAAAVLQYDHFGLLVYCPFGGHP